MVLLSTLEQFAFVQAFIKCLLSSYISGAGVAYLSQLFVKPLLIIISLSGKF